MAAVQGMGLNVIVCGPQGASGVNYIAVSGAPVVCGMDANGNALALQVDTAVMVSGGADSPDGQDGATVGAEIGAAVLGVLAVAYGFRAIRNFVNSSSEG
ncbi:major capsid protein [Paraburkholderia sp. SOS3]|uniref:major capsid protein n=1 Tax=Paraburkholderia sp. SOS3 TaxID=1926494 RepID=UPI00094732A5|nr:major capsid protein [Paraburkholderia sp. SOS3]APR39378.1 hypothetical protein BTO02_29265 [Paraburkholderia sp. SOS3]